MNEKPQISPRPATEARPKVVNNFDENNTTLEDPEQSDKRMVTEEALKDPDIAILFGAGKSFLGIDSLSVITTWPDLTGRKKP